MVMRERMIMRAMWPALWLGLPVPRIALHIGQMWVNCRKPGRQHTCNGTHCSDILYSHIVCTRRLVIQEPNRQQQQANIQPSSLTLSSTLVMISWWQLLQLTFAGSLPNILSGSVAIGIGTFVSIFTFVRWLWVWVCDCLESVECAHHLWPPVCCQCTVGFSNSKDPVKKIN